MWASFEQVIERLLKARRAW